MLDAIATWFIRAVPCTLNAKYFSSRMAGICLGLWFVIESVSVCAPSPKHPFGEVAVMSVSVTG